VDRHDDALEAWARNEGVCCYRGSEEDVLNRVVQAQRSLGSDLVVEVTGDCTLLDPQIIDMGVATFVANSCDLVSNVKYPSFPMGIDVQVFPFRILEEVDRTIADPAVREHVSLYFYENPDRYATIHLQAPPMWHHPDYRFQLDYPEDHRFINEVYRRLEPDYGDAFGIDETLSLLGREPRLLDINRHCEEKAVR
jgi:spore coat polysaccharide biosynthesis protein SpsF